MAERLRQRGVSWLIAAMVLAVGCGSSGPPTTPTPPRPQLLCPANVTVNNVVGAGQEVIYTPPVQTAGTTPTTIVCAPASGSVFPLGSTAVSCIATDSFSQSGSCSFSVTLQPLALSVLTFVAFGDSLTEGQNGLPDPASLTLMFVDPANAYPTKLSQKLAADFPQQMTTVVNAGLGGEFVSDGLARLPGVLAAQQPQALLLLDGFNDLATFGAPAVPDVVDAIEDMIGIAKAAGVQHVFVGTLTPGRTATGPVNRQIAPSLILQTNAQIRIIAPAEGAILVDTFNAFVGRETTLVNTDGLHLTPAGNEVLAETFLAAIKAVATTATGPLSRLRR